ncbi:hypothetical protein Nepgr_025235 [Nepenthes gracilis]|uniref:BZIP domain-containing protein n=1 Tax=Nepenthes gracilis TaxID=150966 RepID=A0AAD3T628_NEPGR|nr:hypothetical protein Nepgr_025235 [Nepenthes gracilis]
MASSSGNSSSGTTSTTDLQGSKMKEDLQQPKMDERKRKRMESNRESAKRSRMRKQKHLDDLTAQITHLRIENTQILSTINTTTQHYLTVESENTVLRAQMAELTQRLESLNEMCSYINTFNGVAMDSGALDIASAGVLADSFMNPWNMPYLSQHAMASAAHMG